MVEIIKRLARPEIRVKVGRIALGAFNQDEFLDDDCPAPHRGQDQTDHHDLHHQVGLNEQRPQREIGYRHAFTGLGDFDGHGLGEYKKFHRRLKTC